MPVAVVGCRTVRDRDLLALSSRNERLSAEEREAAGCLVRALMKACTALSYADAGVPAVAGGAATDGRSDAVGYGVDGDAGIGADGAATGGRGDATGAAGAAADGARGIDIGALRAGMVQLIESEPLARLDYAEVLDGDTFLPPDADTNNVLFAVAAWFGATRLIDNMTYKRNGHEYGCPCCT
jgi:pantothenate synthetase